MNLLKVIKPEGELTMADLTEGETWLHEFNSQLKEFRKRKFMKIIGIQYELEQLGDKYKNLKKKETELVDKYTEHIAKKHNNGWLFITVSPKTTIKLEGLRKKVEKLVKRTFVQGYIYVYEQRGTRENNDVGRGLHTHILVKRNLKYKPSKCREMIENTFKNLVGNVKSRHHLDIQICGDDYAVDKYEYLTGVKTGIGKDGVDKSKKQEADKFYREFHKLEKFYINNLSF